MCFLLLRWDKGLIRLLPSSDLMQCMQETCLAKFAFLFKYLLLPGDF